MAMPAIENRKGPDDSGSPSAAPSSAPGTDQVRPRHGAHGDGPDDEGQVPAPVLGLGKVHRGKARLQVGCVSDAQQGRAGQQHRKRPGHRCQRHQRRAQQGQQQAGDQRAPAS